MYVAPNGPWTESQAPCDIYLHPSSRVQVHPLLVADEPVFISRGLYRWVSCVETHHILLSSGICFIYYCGCSSQTGTLTSQPALDGVSHVLQEMPSIGNWDRVGSAV
ncbi:uncharacterized protein METZ01_LOCUS324121, partial [marine metagenome]